MIHPLGYTHHYWECVVKCRVTTCKLWQFFIIWSLEHATLILWHMLLQIYWHGCSDNVVSHKLWPVQTVTKISPCTWVSNINNTTIPAAACAMTVKCTKKVKGYHEMLQFTWFDIIRNIIIPAAPSMHGKMSRVQPKYQNITKCYNLHDSTLLTRPQSLQEHGHRIFMIQQKYQSMSQTVAIYMIRHDYQHHYHCSNMCDKMLTIPVNILWHILLQWLCRSLIVHISDCAKEAGKPVVSLKRHSLKRHPLKRCCWTVIR